MSRAPASYPAPEHLLRDLRVVVERDERGVTGCVEIVPEMLDATGRVRLGVLATVVDVAGGECAIRAVRPDWIATSDLSVYATTRPESGTLAVRPRVLRKGRQTVVLDAAFEERETGRELGLATLGFAILPARSEFQKNGHWAEAEGARTEFAHDHSRLQAPLLDTLGIEPDPERPGVAHLAVRPYVINSLGAMQGGAIAILLDAAAEDFAFRKLGRPAQLRGLAIHYLKLGRVGPIRAESCPIGETNEGVLLRVSLFDEGQDDALLTVATAHVDAAATT
ncbi:MAG: hypothetical protein JRG86_03115 [Deltaproteobacteria bacterium]|jgi:acyl-coenzyme A thioesterase PaaI-like protein|nr:hypothetical protein [Deltaproteobacteria bacterium]MBW2498975.1 hypothetical protein [Deltaproteobacteria bacterium]